MTGRLSVWWGAWRLRRFHRRCDRLGVPQEVRARMWKAACKTVDWYAGRKA